MKKVLIMAGGTGGHVFPGLALANYFKNQGIEIHWLGTQRGLEATLVPEANIPLHLISINGLRGKGLKTLVAAPFKISQAIWQSISHIKKINPDLIIGMGGFVSGPGGAAAWLTKRPLIIHEQNAKAGLTNKILARFAKKVLQGFPNAFPSKSAIAIGNPVREEIERLLAPQKRATPPLRLLVIGGSLGAQVLNQIMPDALAGLDINERPEILHQTGSAHLSATTARYADRNVTANVVPFIKNMAEAYDWADLVICRSGALTVSELCAAGLPAIFVPFPHAVDDHQTANAEFMVKKNAAICIQQSHLTAGLLTDMINKYARSPELRLEMAQAAYSLRQVKVVEQIYAICKEICP